MNIYIGKLSRTMTEDILRNAFEQYGDVDSVKLMRDRETGELRGFAFVVMPNDDQAQEAIAALNGTDLDGQRIDVNEARPQGERPFRSGPRPGGSRPAGSSSSGRRFGNGGGDSRSSFGGGRDRSSKYNGGGWR